MTRELFIPRRTVAQLPCLSPQAQAEARTTINAIQALWQRTQEDGSLDVARRQRKLASLERLFITELERIDRACGALEQTERDALRSAVASPSVTLAA